LAGLHADLHAIRAVLRRNEGTTCRLLRSKLLNLHFYACKNEQIIKTALANPFDRFQIGIRKLIEDLMVERMGENDSIVTRYMTDQDFQAPAYPILVREIFDAVRKDSLADRPRP
jgi:hypothetical protein